MPNPVYKRQECGWWGNNMGVIIYTFNLDISPKMSYGGLECNIIMLQNYMLMIFVIKRALFVSDPVYLYLREFNLLKESYLFQNSTLQFFTVLFSRRVNLLSTFSCPSLFLGQFFAHSEHSNVCGPNKSKKKLFLFFFLVTT